MITLDLREDDLCDVVRIVERFVVGRQNSLPIEILVEDQQAIKKVIYALEEHDFRFIIESNSVKVLE